MIRRKNFWLRTLSNSQRMLNSDYFEKGTRRVQQMKPYEKIFFTPTKYFIKLEQEKQMVQVRPKFVFDIVRSALTSIEIPQILYISQYVLHYRPTYDAACFRVIEKITRQIIKNDGRDIISQFRPQQIKRLILVFRNFGDQVTGKVEDICCYYAVHLINHYAKEEKSKSVEDNEDPVQQEQQELDPGKAENKMTFAQLQSCYHYVIENGVFTDQILDEYIKQMNLVPEIDQSLASKNPKQYLNFFINIQSRLRGLFHLRKLYDSNEDFQKCIPRDIYDAYLDRYLEVLSGQQIYYTFDIQFTEEVLFVTKFLYPEQTIPKVKSAYSKIFRQLFQFFGQSYGLLISNQVYARIFEVVLLYCSPIEPQDKELVHFLLRQFQKMRMAGNRELRNWSIIPFKLSERFSYTSPILLKQLQSYFESQVFTFQSLYRYPTDRIAGRTLDFLQLTGSYLRETENIEEQQKEDDTRNKLKELFKKHYKRFSELIKAQKPQVHFKKALSPSFTEVDSFQTAVFIKNIDTKATLKNYIEKNRHKLMVWFQKQDIRNHREHVEKSLPTSKNYPFSAQLGNVRLFYYVEATLNHFRLFPPTLQLANRFRHTMRGYEVLKLIKNHICYPKVLRNLVQIYMIANSLNAENTLDEKNTLAPNEIQTELLRFIDNARNTFSLQFKNLINSDTPNAHIQYPNLYNAALAHLKIQPVTHKQISQSDFSLTNQNVRQCLLNDIYAELLSSQSVLKKQVESAFEKIKQENGENARYKVQKDYIDYPYYADFLIRKNTKLIAVIIDPEEGTPQLQTMLANSYEYFLNQKFEVKIIQNRQDLAAFLNQL